MNENQNKDEYMSGEEPAETSANTPTESADAANSREAQEPTASSEDILQAPQETSEKKAEATSGEITDTTEEISAELSEETPAVADVPRHQPASQPVYRWTYAEQKNHDAALTPKNNYKGWLVYAVIMTAVFALSFGLLLGVLFMKGSELPTIQLNEGVTDEGDVADRESIAPVEFAKNSVVVIEVTKSSSTGSGTGIILSSNGYIATNHHVIEGGGSIRVKFYDGTYAEAVIKGSSEVDDLAVLKVERTGLLPATFANSSQCYVGETVYAIGNPGGPDFAWTTTKGIVSYVNREVKIYDDDGVLKKKLKLLQTDAMVNPGNSGGPLVNSKGEVVGVVTMKLADGYEGIGFAIPSNGAVEILNAIIRDGNADSVNSNISYDRPVIGIVGVFVEGGKHYIMDDDRIREVTEEEASKSANGLSPDVSGIYISGVTKGTDAADKLEIGDIITAVNGVKATSMAALMNEINDHYAGDAVQVTYYRNGKSTDVTITLSAAK